MPKERISTSKLLARLFKTSSIKRFVKNYDDVMEHVPFCVHLNHLCSDRGVVAAHVIKKSGIERTYGHQIFNGTHRPSRDKVIQLAFGFKMDFDETQDLLKMACKSSLYPKIKRDAIIIYALNKNYTVDDVQMTLSEMGLRLLGSDNAQD